MTTTSSTHLLFPPKTWVRADIWFRMYEHAREKLYGMTAYDTSVLWADGVEQLVENEERAWRSKHGTHQKRGVTDDRCPLCT